MSESCIVVIAAPDLLPSLKARVEDADTEVLEFSPADALEALRLVEACREGGSLLLALCLELVPLEVGSLQLADLLEQRVVQYRQMRLPEVGVIQTETEQPARQPGAVAESSSLIHPLLVQAAATEFPSVAGAPTVEARGLMFDPLFSAPVEAASPTMLTLSPVTTSACALARICE